MTEPKIGRRSLFATGSAGVIGLAVGAGAGAGIEAATHHTSSGPASAPPDAATQEATERLAPYDALPSDRSLPMGLGSRVPSFGTIVSFDLTPAARRSPAQARKAAISFLTFAAGLADNAGSPLLADAADPEATAAAGYDLRDVNLQITPGLGASLLEACGLSRLRPAAFADVPAFSTDRLDPARSGGDLMIQIAAEDPMRSAGAVQEVLSYVQANLAQQITLRWSRSGFRATMPAATTPGTTVRNLMGHRDGTDNPPLGSPLWRITVQATAPEWMAGGSYLVAREIEMALDAWFTHSEAARDQVIGRKTSNGAPLGEQSEDDPLVLTTLAPGGKPAIAADAHIRLSNSGNVNGARIYRRPWSYDDGYVAGQRRAGLFFLAWQADIRTGFTPIQQSLVRHHDALNRFITHVSSSAFAVPARGEDAYVGQRLLEA